MEKIFDAVDAYRQKILDAEAYIWKNPETGYREVKTSAYLAKAFEDLGYSLTMAENVPGFYTVLDTGKPGPVVLILAELDSLICEEHPECNPETYAVHACGHHAQCAAMLGIAAGLKAPDALENLSGKIKLCLVPAEEMIELEYRRDLIKKGVIRYLGGKTEFMSRGYFDDVDVAFMVHTEEGNTTYANAGSVGCVAKNITYKGVAAHAGGAPWNGVNALYAATQGLNAINSIRETFKDTDIIRVHPIMTAGGSVVNAIPERAQLESYVRGENFEGMQSANTKVNRALCGAALSLGAQVEINDKYGYGPLRNCPDMVNVFEQASEICGLPFNSEMNRIASGSTDMGDISCVMPVVHGEIGGAKGTPHGKDYYIEDKEMACVTSAKVQLATLYLLLKDGGAKATEIVNNFKPRFESKQAYFDYIRVFNREGDCIQYNENSASVNWE